MPRKKTILDELITLPWWFNLALAAVTYFSLKYWLPAIEFESALFRGMASPLPDSAGIFAAIFILIAAISAFHSWRKGELLDRQTSVKSIQNLSWLEFEFLVSEAYRRKGYAVSENIGSGADGGVDVVLVNNSEKILVQCKNWKSSKVGVSIVRELFGVVTAERASKGIVVCSGSYTKDAIEFAKNNNIQLIAGDALARLISTVQKNKQQIQVKSENSGCPVCGARMIRRVAKKGKNSGASFLGCSRFPKCRGTRKL